MRIIHKTPAGYDLEHFADDDPEIFDLFQTWVLPLPFTVRANPQAVLLDQQSRTSQDVYLCECAK